MSISSDIEKHLDELGVELLTHFSKHIPAIKEVQIVRNNGTEFGNVRMSGVGKSVLYEDISICCMDHLMQDLEMRAVFDLIKIMIRKVEE